MTSRTLTLAGFLMMSVANTPAYATDIQVDMHGVVVQKFLTTLGTVGVHGGDSTTVSIPYPGFCQIWDWIYLPCIKWTPCTAQYSWSVSLSNLIAHITPAGIPFTGVGNAQASASICGIGPSLSYSPAINGQLDASWQPSPQEIWLAMHSLNVEVYVEILGFKIHIAWVDVAPLLPKPLYKQKLQFAQQFTLPNPISKQITVTLQNANLALLSGLLRFTGDLNFTSP